MMTRIAIILSLLTFELSLHSQRFGDFVPKADITGFINWKITTDKEDVNLADVKRVNRNIVVWDTTDVDLLLRDSSDYSQRWLKLKGLDTLFTTDDFEYIERQLRFYLGKKEQWLKGELKRIKLIDAKPLDKIKKGDDYWEYSIPIFSKDHSMCIIHYNYICGQLCISWRTALYKKTKDGWKEIKILYGADS